MLMSGWLLNSELETVERWVVAREPPRRRAVKIKVANR